MPSLLRTFLDPRMIGVCMLQIRSKTHGHIIQKFPVLSLSFFFQLFFLVFNEYFFHLCLYLFNSVQVSQLISFLDALLTHRLMHQY